MRLCNHTDQHGNMFRVFHYNEDSLWLSTEGSNGQTVIDVNLSLPDVKNLLSMLDKWVVDRERIALEKR